MAVSTLPAAALADTGSIYVTTVADDGPGSFRAAVAAVEQLPDGARVILPDDSVIRLKSPVTYDGPGRLRIVGNGSTLRPHRSWTADDAPDSGLLVSYSAAAVRVKQLNFVDSPNNGLAVFLPSTASGDYTLILTKVAVSGSEFHGVLVDGQATGFHGAAFPNCQDVHPVSSAATINLVVRDSAVIGNGVVAGGFDSSTATGCPLRFDGLRAEEGGTGSLWAYFSRFVAEDNGAAGIALDERGAGDIRLLAVEATLQGNGFREPAMPGSGADIDEGASGNLFVKFTEGSSTGNALDGINASEARGGTIDLTTAFFSASGNGRNGIGAHEDGGGDLYGRVRHTESAGSATGDGLRMVERGMGSVRIAVGNATFDGNALDGIRIDERDIGKFYSAIRESSASSNGADGIDLREDMRSGNPSGTMRAILDDATITGNGGHGVRAQQVEPGSGVLEIGGSAVSGNGTDLGLVGVTLE